MSYRAVAIRQISKIKITTVCINLDSVSNILRLAELVPKLITYKPDSSLMTVIVIIKKFFKVLEITFSWIVSAEVGISSHP
jgi:hypothetical protein